MPSEYEPLTPATLDYARTILRQAVADHNPVATFALLSGGHDSLTAAHIAFNTIPVRAAVHINTTIGIKKTRQFVRDTCARYGWPLIEKTPPVDYETIVSEHGFPGPAGHIHMYRRLKERCLRALVREHKQGNRRVLLVSGARRQESLVRMGRVEPVQKEMGSVRVWVAPIVEWTGADKNAYLARHRIPRNEVVDLLCMSGECLCGAFAKAGELEYIRKFFPEDAAEIDRIAAKLKAKGLHHSWGVRPGTSEAEILKMSEQMQCGRKEIAPPNPIGPCGSCFAKLERDE